MNIFEFAAGSPWLAFFIAYVAIHAFASTVKYVAISLNGGYKKVSKCKHKKEDNI